MSSTANPFSTAARADCEAHLALLTALQAKAFDGMRKLIDLNLGTAHTALVKSGAAVKQLLDAKSPPALLTLGKTEPASADMALAYGREVAGIISELHADFSRSVQARVAESHRNLVALADAAAATAPDGTDTALAFLKQMMLGAHAGYRQFCKAVGNTGNAAANGGKTTIAAAGDAAKTPGRTAE